MRMQARRSTADLRQLLLESVAPDTVAWGYAIAAVHHRNDGRWKIECADQLPIVADLVVGADGKGSRVRNRLTSARPSYTGHTMVAMTIRKDLWRGSAISDVLGEGVRSNDVRVRTDRDLQYA